MSFDDFLGFCFKGAAFIIAGVGLLLFLSPLIIGLTVICVFGWIAMKVSGWLEKREEYRRAHRSLTLDEIAELDRSTHTPEFEREMKERSEESLNRAVKAAEKYSRDLAQNFGEEQQNAEPETALDDEEEEEETVEKEYDLSAPLHLDNQLTFSQKEKLYAKGYQVLKTSAFGDSGAAHYWVMPRYNESKEHAFFCYLLKAELEKHVAEVELHVTSGPDVVVTWKGKKYCFDVETGKSLKRQPEWLAKKFAYYQKEYDKSFILVTKRTLKYNYAKYGIVITRAMIKETIKKLFRKTAKQPKKRRKK